MSLSILKEERGKEEQTSVDYYCYFCQLNPNITRFQSEITWTSLEQDC